MSVPFTQPKKPIIVAVTGIIGAGKSTIIRRLQETGSLATMLKPFYGNWSPKIAYVREQSKKWEATGDLKLFYSDPEKHAFWFQLMVFDSYVDSINDVMSDQPDIIIVERSLYCQRIFWELQVNLGRSKGHEDRAYRGNERDCSKGLWTKWKTLIQRPSVIVYAKPSTINIAMDRIEKRGRDSEKQAALEVGKEKEETTEEEKKSSGVTKEYEKALQETHDKLYTKFKCFPYGDGPIDCVHVETDQPFHVDNEVLNAEVVVPIFRAISAVKRRQTEGIIISTKVDMREGIWAKHEMSPQLITVISKK